jgi:hypothetical protein
MTLNSGIVDNQTYQISKSARYLRINKFEYLLIHYESIVYTFLMWLQTYRRS